MILTDSTLTVRWVFRFCISSASTSPYSASGIRNDCFWSPSTAGRGRATPRTERSARTELSVTGSGGTSGADSASAVSEGRFSMVMPLNSIEPGFPRSGPSVVSSVIAVSAASVTVTVYSRTRLSWRGQCVKNQLFRWMLLRSVKHRGRQQWPLRHFF